MSNKETPLADDERTPRLTNGERVTMKIIGEYDESRSLGRKGVGKYEGELYGLFGAPCSLGFGCCCDAVAIPIEDSDKFEEYLSTLIPSPFNPENER